MNRQSTWSTDPFGGRPIRRYTLSFFRVDELGDSAKLTWTQRLSSWFSSKTKSGNAANDENQEKGDPQSPPSVDPRRELYKRMVGNETPDEAFEVKWSWYLTFLDNRIIELWSGLLGDVLEGLAPDYSEADLPQRAKVYEVLVAVAEAISTRSEFSMDDVVSDVRATNRLKANVSTDSVRQLVWIFSGYLTMLYDPEPHNLSDPDGHRVLRLRRVDTLARARSRARGTVLTNFAQEMRLAGEQFHQILGSFGELLPKPTLLAPIDRPPILGNIEHLNVAYLSADGLKNVAKIRIEWVNTLELHLQLDQRKRVLRLFRFPTFCQLLFKENGTGFLQRIYEDHRKSQIPADEPEHDLNISDYLREIILSYRLLFGILPRSRQAFREEIRSWTRDGERIYDQDPLLWQLCTGSGASKPMKELLESFDGEETSTLFALEEFPFLGRRLAELQRFAIWQKPNSWMILWKDQRDVKDWWMVWTAWAVLFIGGGTVVLQFFQLGFQIWSTVMQYRSPSSAGQPPAGGL